MKRLAWFTLIILATLTTAIVFWEFRSAVVLFSLSLAVAAAVRPLVDWMAAHRLPRGLALLVTYAICVGGLIALVVILSGPLLANLQQLTKDLASGYEQIKAQWPTGTPLQQSLAQQSAGHQRSLAGHHRPAGRCGGANRARADDGLL